MPQANESNNLRGDLRGIHKIWPSLLALFVFFLALAIAKQAGHYQGGDFHAYYKAGARLLNLSSPYVYEHDYAYKYAPISALPYAFFALLPFEFARWVYTFCHASAVILCLIFSMQITQTSPSNKQFWLTTFIALMGSLRFLDGEFQVSQYGILILFFVLLGIRRLQIHHQHIHERQSGHEAPQRLLGFPFLAMVIWIFGALTKAHSLISLAVFKGELKSPITWRRFVIPTAILTLIMLMFPWPPWVWDWVVQMRDTTPLVPSGKTVINLQGWVPIAVNFFAMEQTRWILATTFVPVSCAGFLLLPEVNRNTLNTKPAVFLLSVFWWILLGVLASPLPWQYTYSVTWVMFWISWTQANSNERKILVVITLILGISPRGIWPPGIWGDRLIAFEMLQPIAWLMTGFLGLLFFQIRRLAKEN